MLFDYYNFVLRDFFLFFVDIFDPELADAKSFGCSGELRRISVLLCIEADLYCYDYYYYYFAI